jgi:GNAT superfamily N-acetyltransferase
MADAPVQLLARAQGLVQRRGVRNASSLVVRKAAARVFHNTDHVWYSVAPGGERPRRALPEGYAFGCGDESSMHLLLGLDTVSPYTARRRLAERADLWFVIAPGGEPAFACWTFHGRTPVFAASGGALTLPDGVSSLEDSVTSAGHRGRGIAPAAWTLVADELARRGIGQLITTIGAENAASRKAIVKAGFRPFAVIRHERRFGRRRVRVWHDGSAAGHALVERLPGEEADGAPPVEMV